jgi:flagellar basal-body rod protein FlgF
MENSIYIGLSRQMALSEKMETIANNVANMSTPGYRAQNMVFKEYIQQPTRILGKEDPPGPISMVQDYGQYQNTESGPVRQTGNALDVAIQGDGWFGIQTPDGLRYTRAGNFTMNADGDLITSHGDKVAGSGGGSITIPSGTREIRIAEDGTVSTEQGSVGNLMVVGFANDQTMIREGNGLYNTSEQGVPVTQSRVKQGMLEGSNVQPVLEMTRMIEVSRAYQATQRMMQDEHERQRTMVQRLTQNG